jgi:hypothetical protein
MQGLTAKSTVYVSLVQVAVTVFGVLAAATSQKIATVLGRQEVFSSELLMDLGLILLVLPLAWIVVVSAARVRSEISDATKRSLLISGFLVLGLLVLWAGYAAVLPWTMPRTLDPAPVETRISHAANEIDLLPSSRAITGSVACGVVRT